MSDERRAELASLRIDRDAPGAGPPSRKLGLVPLLAIALLFVAASIGIHRVFLAGETEVQVDYARRSGPGGAARGTVLTGSGYIITRDRYISLGVRVPGRIEAYRVDEGDAVEAGQVLVELDSRQYRSALRQAEASLRLQKANVVLRRKELVRLQELVSRDVSSEAELDVAVNLLKVAEADVDRLEAEVNRLGVDLEETVLRAPTQGIVLEKLKEVGEIATPGGFEGSGDLIRIANLEELRAEIDVNEADLSKIRLGQPAEVRPDAYPDRRYAATVVKLAAQINRQKGTLQVEVRILEPDAELRPDMSVRIAFLREGERVEEGVVTAPGAALRTEGAETFVWVVTDGRLRKQPVRIGGDAAEDRKVVLSGLLGGETLVVGSDDPLGEDARVSVAE